MLTPKNSIPKDAIQLDNACYTEYFLNSAREGFAEILKSLPESNRRILLPAYIGFTDREGSGVFDPVKQTKAEYKFYQVNHQLVPDHDAIYKAIAHGEVDALLIIHYFGFCQANIQEIAALCKTHGVILIEDCAHTLSSRIDNIELGSFGDFTIYSLHKVLPLSKGGLLKCNTIHIPLKDEAEGTVISTFAKRDMYKINQKRRENYMYLLHATQEVDGLKPMYENLPEGIVPHNFPVIIENGFREKLYFKLIEKGVPVTALYYRMIEEIKKEDYPTSYWVADNILNFPIHQDVETHQISHIAKVIRESINELLVISK